MPLRTTPLVNGQYYHIYNRGVEKRRIFGSKNDYHRFLKTLQYYQLDNPKPRFSRFSHLSKIDQLNKIVEIVSYCLMPNHFHVLIKQIEDNGISIFVSKLINSYTKYFNTKYNRVGPLFQGQFKAILIENDEQLIHLSRYIHLNPLVAHLVKGLEEYKWSSYNEFLYPNFNGFCSKQIILDFFNSPEGYQKFIADQSEYAEELEIIKHQLIEEI